MATVDDGSSSLSEIERQQGNSIVALLLNIQRNSEITPNRVWSFLEKLECLRLPPDAENASAIRVNRELINAFELRRYVALSYTWTASEQHEDETSGKYLVQERNSQKFEPSEVRNCILDRIFNYMRRIGVEFLWIDQHGIIQDTNGCKEPTCSHKPCVQKRQGMDVMDLVYKLSNHPVGLLARPIESGPELRLLASLLQRKLTSGIGDDIRLSPNTSLQEAGQALELLHQITKDNWWHRGWIFQENYKGGRKMKLLIKHKNTLELLKRSYGNMRSGTPIFGNVKGELCISSVDLMEEATRLCLAYRRSIRANPWMGNREKDIEEILETAGKYTLILKPSEPMTPRIVADIEKRQMEDRWDRLAITANCCQYSARLNVRQLRQNNTSLSLAMLALCLLNGEVLDNGDRARSSASEMTVSEFLKDRVFDEFNSPVSELSLTFNKSCRFFNVALTDYGIQTHGHLWKIEETIDTYEWPPEGGWVNDPSGELELSERKQLALLASHLATPRHTELSKSIRAYLKNDATLARSPNSNLSFREWYMLTMAREVANAITRGSRLGLGYLWTPEEGHEDSPTAVFVLEDDGTPSQTSDMSEESEEDGEVYAFTASHPKAASSAGYDRNDLDRHVSFEVEVEGPVPSAYPPIPQLRIRRWLPGLLFFPGAPRVDVVFSWPPDLESISP